MDNQDRQAIEGLFARLGEVERQAGTGTRARKPLSRSASRQQPGAPYLMAQTIVMQEYALQQAQQRIEELEQQQAERPAGGLLSSLFGGGPSTDAQPSPRALRPQTLALHLPRSLDAAASWRGRPKRQWASPAEYCSAMPSAVCSAATQKLPRLPARAAETAADPASDERGGTSNDIFDDGDDED